MLSLLKFVNGPWEQVRAGIRRDFETIETTINQRWAATFQGNNQLTTANGGTGTSYGAVVQRAIVTISNDRILTLPTFPIQLVPAPGGGQRIVPIMVDVEGYFNTAYTNINVDAFSGCRLRTFDMVSILQNDAANALTELSKFYGATTKVRYVADTYNHADPAAAHGSLARVIVSASGSDDTANQALLLYVDNKGSGNFTGGASVNNMLVTTYYGVIAA